MDRVATGADGREWTVRSQLEWRTPVTATTFEHDVGGGHVAASVMMVVGGLFTAVLLLWLPDDVIVPYWVLLLLLLVVLFFPLRWVLRRPWKVVAETDGSMDGEQPAARWVGNVRGIFAMRDEVKRVKKAIEKSSEPEVDGPLRPVE